MRVRRALHQRAGGASPRRAASTPPWRRTPQSYTLTFSKSGEKFTFDSSGNVTSDVDTNGNTIRFNWTSGRMVSITDVPQQRTTTISYDAAGRISQISDASIPSTRNTSFGYDPASGALTSVTDANNKVTRYAYTGSDLTQITDPRGNVTKLSYDGSHRVTALTRVTDPVAGTGPTWTFAYNLRNPHETTVTDPNNHQTVSKYDFQGRVTTVTDALGHSRSTSYTSNSDVQQQTDAAGVITAFSYDAQNNVTSFQLPTGATWQLGYADAAHPYLPSSMKDAQQNTLSYTYDTPGNLTQTSDPNQQAVNAHYNANGTLDWVKDPRETGSGADTTSYHYDAKGTLTGITPPAPLGAIGLTPDGASRIASVTDGKAQTTSYTYDPLDRVTQIGYADRSTIDDSFDANGNLTNLVDTSGATSFTYDALNRLTKKTLPDKSTISYTYDGVGNLTSLTDTAGVVGYAYDQVNRLQTLTEPNNKLTQFGYDDNGRRTSTAYPNGVTMTTTYDNAGRITKIEGQTATGTTLTRFRYSYVNATTGADTGLRQSVLDKDGNTTSYSYDVLNRLTQAQTKNSGGTVTGTYQYQYDAVSNILSKTVNGTATSYSYNGANEITSSGFSYDANGNMTAEASGLALSYNVKDQTASYTLPGSKSAVAMSYSGASQVQRVSVGSSSFTYSELGLRLQTSGTGTTAYTRDQAGTLIGERLPSGNDYYLYDGLGSTVAVTDSSGAVANT